jgi:uncharacterized protein YycO
MKLIFGANRRPGSLLIRLFTFSQWSHVGIIYPGCRVLEAHWPRVRATTVEDFKENYPQWAVAELPCRDEQAALDWAMTQVGKLYDLGGLIAIPFQRRDWQSPGRWFCSELPPAAAAVGGSPWFNEAEISRITPGQLYAVCRPTG